MKYSHNGDAAARFPNLLGKCTPASSPSQLSSRLLRFSIHSTVSFTA